MLGDHGEEAHSYYIYQGAVLVPMIFRLPRSAGRRVAVESGPVGIVDILPTICGLLGVDVPPGVAGVDLSEVLRGAAKPDPQRYVYCESFTPLRYGANSLLGLVGERWKLVQTTRPELYDLSADPRELRNLASEQPDRLARLQAKLRDVLRTQRRKDDESRMQLGAEATRRIESIGYAAGGDISADDGYGHDGQRADPKDRLGLHGMQGKVNGLIESRRYAEARTECLAMLQEQPDFGLALINLGRIDMGLGDFAAAKAHLERGLKTDPHHADGHNRVGVCLTKLGKPREAVARFERALELDPKFSGAHSNLGVALVTIGEVERAIDHYRKALSISPRYADAHVNLGIALQARGAQADAIVHFENAVELRPDLAEARRRLAGALAATGRMIEAVDHFQVLTRLAADDPAAHLNLARALVVSKRSAEALPALADAIRLRPDWPPALNAQAWILATHADAQVRKPEEALRLAQRAAELTRRRDPTMLDTLAAAHAANGDLERAVAVAREALELPGAEKGGLADQIRAHLRSYEAGKPYVEP